MEIGLRNKQEISVMATVPTWVLARSSPSRSGGNLQRSEECDQLRYPTAFLESTSHNYGALITTHTKQNLGCRHVFRSELLTLLTLLEVAGERAVENGESSTSPTIFVLSFACNQARVLTANLEKPDKISIYIRQVFDQVPAKEERDKAFKDLVSWAMFVEDDPDVDMWDDAAGTASTRFRQVEFTQLFVLGIKARGKIYPILLGFQMSMWMVWTIGALEEIDLDSSSIFKGIVVTSTSVFGIAKTLLTTYRLSLIEGKRRYWWDTDDGLRSELRSNSVDDKARSVASATFVRVPEPRILITLSSSGRVAHNVQLNTKLQPVLAMSMAPICMTWGFALRERENLSTLIDSSDSSNHGIPDDGYAGDAVSLDAKLPPDNTLEARMKSLPILMTYW
ncbi:hypothetical protein FHL15_001337 [Xylaria flabelliformis]|uniref:Uncharacterized protein n=1 Tax=Xylaria flabelliformis TaxID=2512241 RepID=A0A553IBL4_9PEZI|nr:hypothetical protein FHL15_001337 [Xylaria flabelliformis]